MFDFAWSEIAVIAAVALLAIGPKDMPVAIRSVATMIKKARRMASEFQTHVDEMVREANLEDVRNQINEIRNFDIRGEIERHVDPDGSMRSTLASNPLVPGTGQDQAEPAADAEIATISEAPVVDLPRPEGVDRLPVAPGVEAPAFIPPGAVAPYPLHDEPGPAAEPDAPAFIPPEVVIERRSRALG